MRWAPVLEPAFNEDCVFRGGKNDIDYGIPTPEMWLILGNRVGKNIS